MYYLLKWISSWNEFQKIFFNVVLKKSIIKIDTAGNKHDWYASININYNDIFYDIINKNLSYNFFQY